MDADQVDGLARSLSEVRTRRWALGLLASAIVGGAFGSRQASEAAGKRGQGNEVCRKGKRLARLAVPATGESIRTPELARGQRYVVRVSGFIQDEDWGLDADYYFQRADPTNLADVYDACFDGTDVGLSIDDALLDTEKFPHWGAYTATHVYERKLIGEGKRARLRLHDCNFNGQSGELTVEIFCD